MFNNDILERGLNIYSLDTFYNANGLVNRAKK